MPKDPGDELREAVDRFLEATVYAPIGFLYEYTEVVPRLVARGKSQVQLAKVMATMAARSAEPSITQSMTEFGRRFGLAPNETSPPNAKETADQPVDDEPSADRLVDDHPTAEPATTGEPWAGYDTMTARDVVSRLPHLSDEERNAVGVYEKAGKARKTILSRVQA